MKLFALMQVLNLSKNQLEPGVLTWRVDDILALLAINWGGSRFWDLPWLVVQIARKALSMGITIAPIRVSSEENLLAEAAIRNVQIVDWWLKQSIVEKYGVVMVIQTMT